MWMILHTDDGSPKSRFVVATGFASAFYGFPYLPSIVKLKVIARRGSHEDFSRLFQIRIHSIFAQRSMWLLIVICVVLFVVKVGFDRRRRSHKHYPPGPRGLPLIGNLLEIRRVIQKMGYDWAAWKYLSGLYGPVLRVQLALMEPLVIITGRTAVLDFLGRREFDGRPDGVELRLRSMGKQRGIVFNDGPEWIEQKRFALKVLKDFGFGTRTMEGLVLEDTHMLCSIISDKMLDKNINIQEFGEVTAMAVISSLWNLIAGKRCDLTKEDSEMLKILRVLNEAFRDGGVSNKLWRYIPFLHLIKPFCSGFSEKEKVTTTMSNYFLDEVAKHKETRISGQPRDLIDTYLDQIEFSDKEKTSSFDELQLIVLLKDLFSAGIETTSNLIGFAIVYLAKYPDVQTKLQYELDQVIGNIEVPRLENKHLLPYLNATIAEVSRLANVAPTTIAHRAVANCSILGYDVEKNWSVIGSLHSIHLDPDHWVDADSFRPERFIDQNGNFVDDPWLIPFGTGRRKCPGENLARISLFLFIASLMQKFRFSLAPKETAPCLLGVNGFTISPPRINIVIKSRSSDKA
ncbi:PREDICTED: probable cytochrome P450 305a1 [Ceratosolen solmsi marchali]|uniref:Probable cytochrome P450 305a1 n=1 Tax=Ceratosolen solmsi marchali TaxID=326594 RepID=A0AAJ6YNV6_9HYME|nr:PREDICTED: probable cytochrome P450 305a1 [Ceratosolen solmsi marchali]XP_011501506.1 PREDICTED: probable cytochrome P450 305a1 [Ceratosolen solmsi marchali]